MKKIEASFEDKISKIETILKTFETEIPLNQAVSFYEEGMKNIDECEKELASAQGKINKVSLVDGEPVFEEIADENSTLF